MFDMRHRRFFAALMFAVTLPAARVQCQQLMVQVEPGKQVVLPRSDIEALPHTKVTTGARAGVTLKAVLEKLELGLGKP